MPINPVILQNLANNTTESSLDLYSSSKEYQITSLDDLSQLCDALQTNKSVKKLKLWFFNPISSQRGMEILCRALQANQNIKELEIYNTPLDSEATIEFGEFLKTNLNILHIRLHETNTGLNEAIIINEALSHNKIIRSLDIFENPIGDENLKILKKEIYLKLKANQKNAQELIGVLKYFSNNIGDMRDSYLEEIRNYLPAIIKELKSEPANNNFRETLVVKLYRAAKPDHTMPQDVLLQEILTASKKNSQEAKKPGEMKSLKSLALEGLVKNPRSLELKDLMENHENIGFLRGLIDEIIAQKKRRHEPKTSPKEVREIKKVAAYRETEL